MPRATSTAPLVVPDFDGAMPEMSEADFRELRTLVHQVTGISLSDSKRTMLSSRIATRLRELGLHDFGAYRARLATKDGFAAEQQSLINAVTTNKTSFFREGHQFDYIAKTVVPWLVERAKQTGKREVTIWSAACSTGQEPWTIAMVLAETLPQVETWKVKILATDIDTAVLAGAERAVYRPQDIEEMPTERVSRHFVRDHTGHVRVKDALRKWVTFRQLNFISDNWPLKVKFDFIMCRNASIYFDLPTQQKLFTRLLNQTIPRGWIFVGHAEVLHWLNERIEGFQGGIYRSKATGSSASGLRPMPPLAHPVLTLPAATLPPPAPVPSAPRPPRPSAVPLPRPSARVRSPGEAENLEVVNINAGEAHSSDSPVEIKTVLGSCVAACLYDPVAKIGGMNHFLLPSSGSDDPIDRQRFGIHAMETLINSLMKLGADRSRLKGKLFGGGNVLTNITRRPTVGEMNAEFAENFLRTEGIPVTASRLGGETGVEVRFHPHTGRAFLRDISRGSVELKDEEKSISAPKLAAGDAELF